MIEALVHISFPSTMSASPQHDITGVFKLDELQKQKIERTAANIPVDLAPMGARIRAQRKQLGLSRSSMAKRVGCTEAYLLEIEIGAVDIGFDLLDRITGVCGCDLRDLLLDQEASQSQQRLVETARIWSKSRKLTASEVLSSLSLQSDES